MTRATLDWLCMRLRPYLDNNSPFQHTLTIQHRVAIAVYTLASAANYRTIGNLFGVGKSTVGEVFMFVCKLIDTHLFKEFVRFPVGERLDEVVNGFHGRHGFPQCIGAIDGTHIPVTPPRLHQEDYRNRKGWFSLNNQCVVDHQGLFLDVFAGFPGRAHDARVFANSPLSIAAERQRPKFPQRPRNIQRGGQVPLVLIGDPAYPLKEYLMKPFRHTVNITRNQRAFNLRLNRARVVVEMAFGRLKGRWRILMKCLVFDLDNISPVFRTCCVLHNMCEMWREDFLDEWLEVVMRERVRRQQPPRHHHIDGQFRGRANNIRDAFVLHFN